MQQQMHLQQQQSPPPAPEAIYEAPEPPGGSSFPQQQQQQQVVRLPKDAQLVDTMGKVPQKPEDIYPYATFVLPDGSPYPPGGVGGGTAIVPSQTLQSGFSGTLARAQAAGQVLVTDQSAPGTVRHADMLVLHENSTLPLSDANLSVSSKWKPLK